MENFNLCHSCLFRASCFVLRALSLLFISFAIGTVAFAEVAIETSVSRSALPVGEQLILDIIVSDADGRIEQPKITSIDGFTSYSQGRSQELTIINGKSSSRSIFSYVLVANSAGEKTIGPIQIVIGGKEYKVAPIKVAVTQNGSGPPMSNPSWSQAPVTQPPSRALPGGNVGDQDIFAKAWLDKDEVYVNEPVMLSYTLFTRLSATYKGFEKEAVTTGFWVEDFPPEKTVRRTEQMLNGQRYVVADVRKLALFPTKAGVFTIDPGTLSATAELRSEDTFDTFFSGNIFGSRRMFPSSFLTQVVSKTLSTDSVKIVVKALPETGKPASFSGAVGQYSIESSIDKPEVEAGNPVTFRVRISGQGNINTLQPPALPKSNDFKIYDSSSSTNISKERLIVEGEKVTETVIVPKKAGTFTIPALSFSYFDPKTRSYRELKTEPHLLTVTKGAEPESAAPETGGVQAVAKEDVGLVTKDIHYIKTVDDGKIIPDKPLYQNPLYWLINLLLIFGTALAAFLSTRKETDLRDMKGFRFRRSHALARGKLKASLHFLKQDKSDAFYEEVSKAVYGYFSDKLNVPTQNVSREKIEQLAGSEAIPELLNKVGLLFDELSRGRFTRSEKSHEDMKNVYDLADEVITKFEKVRKK